jgi:hypothetical protein
VSLLRLAWQANSRLICSCRFSFTSPQTLQRAILDCKNYFRFKPDFIDDYSILISGWIDEAIVHSVVAEFIQWALIAG